MKYFVLYEYSFYHTDIFNEDDPQYIKGKDRMIFDGVIETTSDLINLEEELAKDILEKDLDHRDNIKVGILNVSRIN